MDRQNVSQNVSQKTHNPWTDWVYHECITLERITGGYLNILEHKTKIGTDLTKNFPMEWDIILCCNWHPYLLCAVCNIVLYNTMVHSRVDRYLYLRHTKQIIQQQCTTTTTKVVQQQLTYSNNVQQCIKS